MSGFSNSQGGEGRFPAMDAQGVTMFHGKIDAILVNRWAAPDTQIDMLDTAVRETAIFRIGQASGALAVRVCRETDMGTGSYVTEVSLYESGESEEQIGPRLRSYVGGTAINQVIRHGLPPEEFLEMLGGREVALLQAQEAPDAFEGASIEASAGLDNATVGYDELMDLHELLGDIKPFSMSDRLEFERP